MAGATGAVRAEEAKKVDDLVRFQGRFPKVTKPPQEVTEGRIAFLEKNRKLKDGPHTGKKGEVTILFALTKPTGESPHGEIVHAVKRATR